LTAPQPEISAAASTKKNSRGEHMARMYARA